MELKVGMYVRYRHLSNTKISKIFRIDESDEDVFVALDNDDGTLESFIINASDNIIDLIEVGDYVNGYKVEAVYLKGYRKYIKLSNAYENGKGIRTYSEDIKSVVTKEQFESIKYEV